MEQLSSLKGDDFDQIFSQIPFQRAKEERTRSGWVSPHDDVETPYYISGDNILFALKTEEKKIDASEKKELIDEETLKWKRSNPDAKRVPKEKKSEIASKIEDMLFRDKFISTFKTIYAWINLKEGLLIVNTTSDKKAAQLNDLLNRSACLFNKNLIDLKFKSISVKDDVSFQLSRWVDNSNTIPDVITLGLECSLLAGTDSQTSGGAIAYKKQPVDSDEKLNAYVQNDGYDIVQMKLAYEDEESSLSATFTITSVCDIKAFSLGQEYKVLLSQSEYDSDVSLFDLEFNTFAEMTLQIALSIYGIFGGIDNECDEE